MEFTKDIYFDNSLTNGKAAKITYSGMLYKQGSQCINLVSGFGENWENTTTKPMQKIENGFEVDMEIKDYDTFNFCFSNENNCWDNNNSFNYVSPILPAVVEEVIDTVENIEVNNEVETPAEVEVPVEVQAETTVDFGFDKLEEEFAAEVPAENNQAIEFGTDYSASIDDIIEDILGNTIQNSMSNDTESVDDILNSISKESMPEIEALFNELFFEEADDSLFDEPVEEIVSTPAENSEIVELFDELFEESKKPLEIEVENNEVQNNVENIEVENNEVQNNIENIEVENVEVQNNVEEIAEIQEELNNAAAFSMDNLVEEVLEPVIASTINNEDSIFDNTENTITEETSLVAIENGLQVSSRRLGFFYSFKKRLSLACYKLFVKAPKEIAKQLGFYFD